MPFLESRDVVGDTLAPFSPELVRGTEHLEAFTLFSVVVTAQALSRDWPPDGFCLPFAPRCQGCFSLWATALDQSSRDQLVVLLPASHQPVAATDQLTSRFSPVFFFLRRRDV